MSIEQAIQNMTDALNRNAAAIEEANKHVAAGASTTDAAADTSAADKKAAAAAEKKKAAADKKAAEAKKKAAADEAAAEAEVDKEPKTTQPQLLAKIKEVAVAFDKETAREQFSPLGYEKMADIKPEHYDEVYASCEAKLNGGSDDL